MEEDIWMQRPIGLQVDGKTEAYFKRNFILKLNHNLCRLKQGGCNLYENLTKSLIDQGLKNSDIDPCLYIGNGTILLTYGNDCIIL